MSFARLIRLLVVCTCLVPALPGCKKSKPQSAAAPTPPAQPPDTSWVAENNHGVALIEQFDFDAAARAFEKISGHRFDQPDIAVNWGIALLNRRGEGDEVHAEALFSEVARIHPDHLRAAYCLGLLELNAGDFSRALGQFSKVKDADPSDAYAVYYRGQCLVLASQPGLALTEFDHAIALDPMLRSATYAKSQLLQQLGQPEKAAASLAEFQRLADDPRAEVAEFKYTRMGKKAEATTIDLTPAAPLPPPSGPLFADDVPLKILNGSGIMWRKFFGDGPRPTITAADIDGDGRLDLFITSAIEVGGKIQNAVLLQRDDGFELDLTSPLTDVSDVNAAVWGDFDNDGLVDLYLCRHGPNRLFRQASPGKWTDVTESSHASGGNFNTIDAAAVDADHDGDLDLFLVRGDGPTELLNNNLDGTFSAIGEKAGIAGDGRPAAGLLVADLNHDGLVDLMVVKQQPPNDIFINDGIWKYHRDAHFDLVQKVALSAAVAFDADGAGQPSIFAIHDRLIGQFHPDASGTWVWQSLSMKTQAAFPDPANHRLFNSAAPLAIADITGDGTLHAITSGATGWTAFPLRETASATQSRADLTTWTLVNFDPATGPSIVGLNLRGMPVICRPGPGRFAFAALSLTGKSTKPPTMRSNASGIGVNIAARADSRWTVASTYRNQSGPGQSAQPTALGMGTATQFDFVRLTWPDGLQQTELNVPAGKLTHTAEVQRQTSSCPVIFAWDGKQYAFVTDCLGGGGIGFATGPGEYAPERPVENVALTAGLLQEKDGRLILKIGEPMEEACYLDGAVLSYYDLPAGWSLALDERMAVNDPQPTGRPRFYQQLILPSRAVNDRGEDITQAITKVDGIAAEPGERDPRFIGFTKEHSVEMTFDRPIDNAPAAGSELMLLADGWIEYPYSQTMFAAWQAKALYRAPTLEARGTDGKWQIVLKEFGYPAGMPRQMSVLIPRDKLPAGTVQLRIRTDQEIYWDRLALAWSQPCPEATRRTLPLKAATLADVGFPFRTTGPQQRPNYDYARRLPVWDTRHQAGWYTAFGRVDELLAAADDACVTFGPGEEVELRFEAPADSLRSGWERHYVLELAGWCKDRDLYTKDGRTLAPLPRRDSATSGSLRHRDELYRKFNTRYWDGN